MSRIKILPSSLTRKIAAGEVIERPASVVKELIENALDAQAKKIDIYIEKGGMTLIKVKDDGIGMELEDLEKCFLPHATSKIRTLEDLYSLHSLGFRGEALASIAAVSQLTILSRAKNSSWGGKLRVSFGKFLELMKTGAPKGTVVEVRDLFENMPARKAFLKSLRAESARVVEVTKMLALASPRVSFSLYINGRSYFSYFPSQDSKGLLAQISNLPEEEIWEVKIEERDYKIHLLISNPQYKFSTGKYVYFLVNGRIVKDKFLWGAFVQGISMAFNKGTYPAALVSLELPPSLVDVNVHPAKWEIRFKEERRVFTLIKRSLEEVFRFKVALPLSKEDFDSQEEDIPVEGVSSSLSKVDLIQEKKGLYRPSFISNISKPFKEGSFKALAPLGKNYFLFEIKEGVLILDYHAAHERILYEEIKEAYEQGGLSPQGLLIPEIISLSAKAWKHLEDWKDVWRRLGYRWKAASSTEIRLLSIPALLTKNAIQGLVEILEGNFSSPGQILHDIFSSLACRSAIKGGDHISLQEAEDLLKKLQRKNLTHCPHGRPIFWKITYDEIEKRLGRKQ